MVGHLDFEIRSLQLDCQIQVEFYLYVDDC